MKFFGMFLSIFGFFMVFECILYGIDIQAFYDAIKEAENIGLATPEALEIFTIWFRLVIRIMLTVSCFGLGVYIENKETKENDRF